MTGNASRIFRVELIGAAFMIAAGSVLHFAFDWLGGWYPLALVAAVNESIWEHLKLAFWPGVAWGVLIRPPEEFSRLDVLAAKGFSLLATAALIVVIAQFGSSGVTVIAEPVDQSVTYVFDDRSGG